MITIIDHPILLIQKQPLIAGSLEVVDFKLLQTVGITTVYNVESNEVAKGRRDREGGRRGGGVGENYPVSSWKRVNEYTLLS